MNQHQPKNYLIESILVTIFCCLPFGIVGIVFAAQVNAKFDAGDYEGAIKT
ncbi:MAG: CD225/dispanin family protein, partial [Lutibacter sp.]